MLQRQSMLSFVHFSEFAHLDNNFADRDVGAVIVKKYQYPRLLARTKYKRHSKTVIKNQIQSIATKRMVHFCELI